jgi:signal transduction histidine kinase
MVNLTLKQKVLLLTLIPLIAILGIVMFVANMQLRVVGEHQIEAFRAELLESKHNEVKNYVELALSSIEHIYDHSYAGDQAGQEKALEILTELSYGKGGGRLYICLSI